MTRHPRLAVAQRLALALPAALLAGAYAGQFWGGLYPCEMCLWQRYPHMIALALAVLAYFARPSRVFVALAAGSIIASGLIGAFHAGVEYGWWQGLTSCASGAIPAGGNGLDAIMQAPVIRCDRAPWTLLGVSLAGYNFLISALGGAAIFWLLRQRNTT